MWPNWRLPAARAARSAVAQDKLRGSEELYRQAVENSPNPIFFVDAHGQILNWNNACEKALRFERTLVGSNYRAVLWNPDEEHSAIDAMLLRVFQGDSVSGVYIRYASRDGTLRLMVSRLYPVIGPRGRVEACVFANTDVTEQKHTEEALRRSEARYRALVANSSEGIFLYEGEQPISISLSEDEQIEQFFQYGRLAECNDIFALMYGSTKAGDLIGSRLGDWLPRSDPRDQEYLRAFIRSGYHLVDAESYEADWQGTPRYFA